MAVGTSVGVGVGGIGVDVAKGARVPGGVAVASGSPLHADSNADTSMNSMPVPANHRAGLRTFIRTRPSLSRYPLEPTGDSITCGANSNLGRRSLVSAAWLGVRALSG